MANKKEADVVYEIRADDSRVEQDIEQANKKVEQAAKKSSDEVVKVEQDKTKKLKSETDKTVESVEKAADKTEAAWKDAGRSAQKSLDDISADDVDLKVNADTGKAESAIRNVSKDKSIDVDIKADNSDAKKALDDLEDEADDAGKKISESLGAAFSNVGNLAKGSLSDAATSSVPLLGKVSELTSGLSGTAVAAMGIGAAMVGVGAIAVNTATDMSSAMNGFAAETGASKEEMERYQGVLEKVYANNYGDSFEDIADAMADIRKNLGDMDDESLQNVTESAFALRDTFEYEIPESTRAAKAMMDNFGTSGEDAMDLIAAGAQNGLDYSGELLDSISEYSVQFAKLGLDADDMFKIFQKGADTGAFNLDKVGDAVKELSIRVVDGSDTTAEGFTQIGLNAEEMSAKFAEGGDSAKEAFQETINALASMEDPLKQNTAGVDLFGTMWEDLGVDAVTALADISDGAYDTADAMGQIKKVKYDDLSSMMEALKRNVELLLLPLGESLMPILLELVQAVLPVVQSLLVPLIDLLAQILSPVLMLISEALQPLLEVIALLMNEAISPLIEMLGSVLKPIFDVVFNAISDVVDDKITGVTDKLQALVTFVQGIFADGWKGAWEKVKKLLTEIFGEGAVSLISHVIGILQNLIGFIVNVFTGNWRGAWENVKGIFKNAVGALEDIFKRPLNAIVSGWNKLVSGLGKVKVPDWVPIAGGKSINLPKLPKLRVGMDYVPEDDFPAILHKGEAVLTAEENRRLQELGGISGLESMTRDLETGQDPSIRISGTSRQPIIIENHMNIDGREAARSMAYYLGEQLSWEVL